MGFDVAEHIGVSLSLTGGKAAYMQPLIDGPTMSVRAGKKDSLWKQGESLQQPYLLAFRVVLEVLFKEERSHPIAHRLVTGIINQTDIHTQHDFQFRMHILVIPLP